MQEQEAFDFSVIEQVSSRAPISFDDLARLFKSHTWNRLFAATDRLSREGALAIRRIDRGTYLISLGPRVSGRAHTPRAVSPRLSA